MGMVKTAVRYSLQLGQSLPELLDGLNRVLPAVKEPYMYATLAGLRFHGSNDAEYITAGHLPLLQYRRRQRDVVRFFAISPDVLCQTSSRRLWGPSRGMEDNRTTKRCCWFVRVLRSSSRQSSADFGPWRWRGNLLPLVFRVEFAAEQRNRGQQVHPDQ
jgi:Stage II sporulation protein E (SpoIIE)